MSYTLIKLADEPILIVHIAGNLNPDVHLRMSVEIADLLNNIPGMIYRINDTTQARFNLVNTIAMLEQGMKGWPGTASDPRIISLMVMNHGNAFLGINHMLRNWEGAKRIRMFRQLSDALTYARMRIVEETVYKNRVTV